MAEGRRGGANSYRVISGGAGDPLVLAGTVDPTVGAGISAPEGSTYLRYVSGAGTVWTKVGVADTAWARSATGDGNLVTVADLVALAALDTGTFPDGSLAYVQTLDDIYTLDRTTPRVAAAGGAGYWVAQVQGRWDDLQGAPAVGNAAAALTNEAYRDTAFRMLFFRYDQNDALDFVYQLPHKWKTDQIVYPHLHLLPVADPAVAQDAYFTGYYAWSKIDGDPIPALAGWTTFAATLTVNPGDVYVQKVLLLAAITPPVGAVVSELLLIHMVRAGTNVLDTYNTNKVGGTPAANLAVLSSDVHYRAAHFGTILQYGP